jgi:hypothetical protein
MVKIIFIDPCKVCDTPHACDECHSIGNIKMPTLPKRNTEGKIVIASGEDVNTEESYVVA